MNDFGKIYNVERKTDISGTNMISELRAVENGDYDDDLVYVEDVDMSALDPTFEE